MSIGTSCTYDIAQTPAPKARPEGDIGWRIVDTENWGHPRLAARRTVAREIGESQEFAACSSYDPFQVANELFVQRIVGCLECL
jgi:hypothetical protein